MSVDAPGAPGQKETVGWRSLQSRQGIGPLVLGAAAVLLVMAIVGLIWWRTSSNETDATVPGWEPGVTECPSDPLGPVSRPGRLDLLSACATVSGRVLNIVYRRDGNIGLEVEPDSSYRTVLQPANEGVLRVEVLPRHAGTLTIPAPGQHAQFYGAWVLNTERKRSPEMHPTWYIAVEGQAPKAAESAPSLKVDVYGPESVTSGGKLQLAVAVQERVTGSPLAGVKLLLQFVPNGGGQPVRWETAETNMQGEAAFNLVAIASPGDYNVWVYAIRGNDTGTGTVKFKVKSR